MYVYGAVPPVADTDATPLTSPEHVTAVPEIVAANNAGSLIVVEVVVVQPLEQVTVQE
jgi:hypothetical protein